MTVNRSTSGVSRCIFAIFILSFATFDSYAQSFDKTRVIETRNAVYVELAGNGYGNSVNYERMLGDRMYARAGVGYFTILSAQGVTLPLMAGALVGQTEDRLELGAGVTVSLSKDLLSSEVVATGTFGYRYQRRNGGFLFRVGLTPFWGKDGLKAWGGISMGYRF